VRVHRLGDVHVELVRLAGLVLQPRDSHPTVVTGDGARGVPERAPYDRIIATCTLTTIPRSWLAQCVPGARILAPLATGLIALEVRDPDHAEGRFLHTSAFFVPLRGSARPGPESEPARTGGVPRRARSDDLFRFLLALTAGRLDPHDAYTLWEREGRPQRERYGVTVGEEGVRAWLDDPEGPYTWQLP